MLCNLIILIFHVNLIVQDEKNGSYKIISTDYIPAFRLLIYLYPLKMVASITMMLFLLL